MRNSIILPFNYEKIFVIEAKKSGLIKPKEICDDSSLSEIYHEDEIYNRCYRTRQNLFQMILLYDELIMQDFDAAYDFNKINSFGHFKIYPFEDFYYFDAVNHEDNSLYAEYLKPAMLKCLKKGSKDFFESKNNKKVSYSKLISELYDYIFGVSDNISENAMQLLKLNEKKYELKYLDAPPEFTEMGFETELNAVFTGFYDLLCWELKISTEHEAYIVNSEFQLSKIGCDIYEENINTYLDAYKILKCECANIIGTLPHMCSIEDAILLKQKRKKDIKNLREVIDNLENVLRSEGREKAIIKAVEDVKKASTALSKCERVNRIGKWTTLFSVPVGVIEMLLGGGFGGLGLSVIGTATCLIDEKIKKNNGWCEVIR